MCRTANVRADLTFSKRRGENKYCLLPLAERDTQKDTEMNYTG